MFQIKYKKCLVPQFPIAFRNWRWIFDSWKSGFDSRLDTGYMVSQISGRITCKSRELYLIIDRKPVLRSNIWSDTRYLEKYSTGYKKKARYPIYLSFEDQNNALTYFCQSLQTWIFTFILNAHIYSKPVSHLRRLKIQWAKFKMGKNLDEELAKKY